MGAVALCAPGVLRALRRRAPCIRTAWLRAVWWRCWRPRAGWARSRCALL